MPSEYYLQPNGLICRWSSIVDGFTDFDLTMEEAIFVCHEKWNLTDPQKAVVKVQSVVAGGYQRERFRECLEILTINHGAEYAEKQVRRAIGDRFDDIWCCAEPRAKGESPTPVGKEGEDCAWYLATVDVVQATGTRTLRVRARSPQEAEELANKGEGEFVYEEIEVQKLGRSHVTGYSSEKESK